MSKINNIEESIKDYLKRGGQIEKIPTVQPQENRLIRSTITGPVNLLTLNEGSLFYSEKNKRKKKIKIVKLDHINLDDVPEELRKKLGV